MRTGQIAMDSLLSRSEGPLPSDVVSNELIPAQIAAAAGDPSYVRMTGGWLVLIGY